MKDFFNSKLFLKRRGIIDFIRRNREVTRQEIQQRFSLQTSTTAHIVNELARHKIIQETVGNEIQVSGAGRPSGIIQINPGVVYLVGLDFDREQLTGSITDINGRIIISKNVLMDYRSFSRQNYIGNLLKIIQDLKHKLGRDWSKVGAIGVGAPGIVNSPQGVMLSYNLIKDCQNVPLTTIINAQFGLPVFIASNSSCFALGEGWNRKLPPDSRIISILLRTGVGLGLVQNLKTIDLCGTQSSEFGHTILNFRGPKCKCGQRGCIETYCSGAKLIDKLRKSGFIKSIGNEYRIGKQRYDKISLKTLGKIAAQGKEKILIDAIKELSGYLGYATINANNLFHPDKIIINTRLNKAHSIIRTGIEETLGLNPDTRKFPEIIISQKNDEIGTVGAALMALERIFANG